MTILCVTFITTLSKPLIMHIGQLTWVLCTIDLNGDLTYRQCLCICIIQCCSYRKWIMCLCAMLQLPLSVMSTVPLNFIIWLDSNFKLAWNVIYIAGIIHATTDHMPGMWAFWHSELDCGQPANFQLIVLGVWIFSISDARISRNACCQSAIGHFFVILYLMFGKMTPNTL
jgi:hypothetical protein